MSDRRSAPEGIGSGPLLFVFGLVVGLLCALVTDRLTMSSLDRDLELVRAVHNLALRDFVHEVEAPELIDDALQGMLGGLDNHSRFYGPDEIAQVNRETTGEFVGIGVVFRDSRVGEILFPFPSSPAEKAGLRVGDRILEIDGRVVAELETGELQKLIQESNGRKLELLLVDLDGAERRAELRPEQVIDPTVRHARMLAPDDGVGYLAITSFSHRTPDEFDDAVRQLQAQGLERLIVDLRFNPGGILDAAVRVANRFIREGTIVSTRTRSDTEVTAADPDEALYADLALVLLVDGSSASASEVLAGALQDHCAAALVGAPTYGKGTVQTLHQFSDARGIVKLTTARYYTPSWRPIERFEHDSLASGIAPDHVVELPDDERQEVYGFLRSYSPPAAMIEAIEAWEARDDVRLVTRHPSDRQLDAAVALLTGTAPAIDGQVAH